MQPSTITLEERNRLTDQNAHLFKARHVNDYWPSEINSQRMMDFIESQLGMPILDWPYPIHLEQFELAFEYLSQNAMLFPRPEEEPEPEDPAVIRERAAQQRVTDDYDAKVAADKIARDRAMPISQLGAKVSQQNAEFREQRDQNLLPTRTPGLESRPLSTVTLGVKATARANVALANPTLDRNGADFARLYAAELSSLRS